MKFYRSINKQYAQIYLENQELAKWPYLATIASDTVADMLQLLDSVSASFSPLSKEERQKAFDMLYEGGLDIYRDMSWQLDAYVHSGIDYLNTLKDQGQLDPKLFNSWKLIDMGLKQSLPDLVWQGNEGLVDYEQNVVLQKILDNDRKLWKKVTDINIKMGIPTVPEVELLSNQADYIFDSDINTKYLKTESFENYMKKHGYNPDYGDPVQRWKWIKEVVIPAGKSLEADPSKGLLLIQKIILQPK